MIKTRKQQQALVKKKSPLNNSPLNGAYEQGVDGGINTYRPSDRQAFDALQGKISGNMNKYMDKFTGGQFDATKGDVVDEIKEDK
tara:strand:- start:14 stop:268 length:255 start_codon:yes stop_codon:yes gene_type:complete